MADVALDANVVVGLLDKEDSLNARARELVRAPLHIAARFRPGTWVTTRRVQTGHMGNDRALAGWKPPK